MVHWTEYIQKENLTEDEIELIPSRCGISQLSRINRYISYGLNSDLLVQGLPFSINDFNSKDTWLNPYQTKIFDRNYLKNLPERENHKASYNSGLELSKEYNTFNNLLIKSLSLKFICNNISRENRKFNNEYLMEILNTDKDTLTVLMRPYPFFKEFSMGHECHFVRGVIDGVITLKKSLTKKSRELCCSTSLESIIDNYYQDQNLLFKGKYLYFNDIVIAEYSNISHDLIPKHSFIGYKIINDFYFNEEIVFKKGEIYNAPFCCYIITY